MPGMPRATMKAITAALPLGLLAAPAPGADVAFQDATASAGVAFQHALFMPYFVTSQAYMSGGIAVADFNRDGWQDIFWIAGGVQPDRLYINDGDGTFTNRAAEWGVAVLHGGCGACAGDYDGDGWIDLFVTSFGTGTNGQGQVGKHRLYRNNGNGSFTDMAAQAGVNFTSTTHPGGYGAAFGDYDLDGDLDLAVATWFASGAGNRLFRNNGDGTFTNVTGSVITFPPLTWGFQPCFSDMDDDGWPDLLFAADFKTSRYFHNNGNGTFSDMTAASGTGKDQNGMGQCVADFDRNGRLDWYVTSIYLDAPQPLSGEGNKLYLNQGGNSFTESSVAAGVADGGWGWGAVAIDANQDGWQDIVEVNGRPNNSEFAMEQEYLWINDGDGTFTEQALSAGITYQGEGKGIAALDYDRDGRMDLAITFNNGPSKLYRNAGTNNHWIHLAFDTSANPRIAPDGLNARVEVVAGGVTQVRDVDGGVSYLSSGEIAVNVGLGSSTLVDQIRVHWPRGYLTVLSHVPADLRLVISAPSLADLDANGFVGAGDLGVLLGDWGPLGTSSDRKSDLDGDGVVNGADLGVLLGLWGSR